MKKSLRNYFTWIYIGQHKVKKIRVVENVLSAL